MLRTRRKFLRQSLRIAAGALALPAVRRGAFAQATLGQAAFAQATRPLAERLADYADRLRFDDLDAATIERVKAHVIDTLGCGLAAFDEPPVRICREVAFASGGDGASVIGAARRTSPELAAFANGAAFRYYDLNDSYVGGLSGHPSDNIAACLAVAEAERASARDLIVAIVLAYEINCRLIDAFDVTARGWDSPVFSLPAVALAAGKLMRLTPDRLAHAVALALNDHIPMGQTRAQALSDWKGLADAEAGRNAVFAARLARAGLTGPAPIFEGTKGFIKLISGPAEVDVGAFGGPDLGLDSVRLARDRHDDAQVGSTRPADRPFRIHQCGMKAYPAVVYSQTAIVAAIAVAEQAGELERIAAVAVATTRRGFQQAGSEPEKWAPDTKETADHSLPYLVARAMFDREISNASYAPDKLRDPRILAFMRRITVAEDPAFAKPNGNAPPTRVTATLTDGRQITRQVDDMPGFPGKPMTRAEVERKFLANVGKRWPAQRADEVLQALWALDRADDLPGLLGRLSRNA
jgi:2-methylcitrate dehydratase